jgi:hypothetical protein
VRYIIILLALSITPAVAADSCSSWKQFCTSSSPTATTDDSTKKCTAAANECIARCKKGQKYFVGPFNGRLHPVDTCS